MRHHFPDRLQQRPTIPQPYLDGPRASGPLLGGPEERLLVQSHEPIHYTSEPTALGSGDHRARTSSR